MPKRMLLIGLALASLALAACGATYNPNDLYGTPVPTATPSPPTTPNPTISAAIVDVSVSSSPLPFEPVNLYSSTSTSPSSPGHVNQLLQTQETNADGTVTFSNLTPATNYCFSASYTPTSPGSTPQTQTICTDLWGFGIDFAF